MNDVAVRISTATWRGKSATSAGLRPLIFRRTNSFELTDLDAGKASARNIHFARQDIAVANVISTGHAVSLEENDRLTYMLVTQGQAEIQIRDKTIVARPGQGVLLGLGPRVTQVGNKQSANYHGTALLIPKGVLQDTSLDPDGSPLGNMLGRIRGAVAPASDAFHRLNSCMWYTMTHLLAQASVTPSLRVTQSAEQLLLDLFNEAVGDILQTGLPGSASADLKKVQQAEEFMRANLDRGIQLADVCQAVGVSARSLQIAFQRCRDVSPITSLRRFQLEEIHRRLVDETNDKTLTEIAHDCGWTHLGRLSAAFREQFGEAPSVIRRKARSGWQ